MRGRVLVCATPPATPRKTIHMLTKKSPFSTCFVIFFLVGLWATATAQDFELRDLDLTNWDCLPKLEGSAKTQDGKERNRQKNRSAADLAGMKIVLLDTAAFLKRVGEYDQNIPAKHRRDLVPAQKEQVEAFEKEIVSLTGWLGLAYQGVPESANCRSSNSSTGI